MQLPPRRLLPLLCCNVAAWCVKTRMPVRKGARLTMDATAPPNKALFRTAAARFCTAAPLTNDSCHLLPLQGALRFPTQWLLELHGFRSEQAVAQVSSLPIKCVKTGPPPPRCRAQTRGAAALRGSRQMARSDHDHSRQALAGPPRSGVNDLVCVWGGEQAVIPQLAQRGA